MRKYIFVLFAAFNINACSSVMTFDKVSDSAEFAHLVGITFKLKSDIQLALVKAISKSLHNYYVLVPAPGFGGPEIIDDSILKENERITVLDVLKCNNCWSNSPTIEMRVRILNNTKTEGTVTYLDATFGEGVLIENPDGGYDLDRNQFEPQI